MSESIALPARTRAIIERALTEQQTMHALLQQQQQRITDLVETARELLDVPPDWSIRDTAIGFEPPAQPTAPPPA